MTENPLKEILNDDQYVRLKRMGFLNDCAVRDYYIRKKFNMLKGKIKSKHIIEDLQQEFSYLSIESTRKIVYYKPSRWINIE